MISNVEFKTLTIDWVTGFGGLLVGGLLALCRGTTLPELTWCRLEWELISLLLKVLNYHLLKLVFE